jgi:hypothetical protein
MFMWDMFKDMLNDGPLGIMLALLLALLGSLVLFLFFIIGVAIYNCTINGVDKWTPTEAVFQECIYHHGYTTTTYVMVGKVMSPIVSYVPERWEARLKTKEPINGQTYDFILPSGDCSTTNPGTIWKCKYGYHRVDKEIDFITY